MARIGKCINYATCSLAYQNADISTENEFVCPECGQPLREAAAPAGRSAPTGKTWIMAGIGAGLVVLIIAAFFISKALLHRRSESSISVAENASATPATTPVAGTPTPANSEPVTTPPPVKPERKPPVAVVTPEPVTPAPQPATPLPSTVTSRPEAAEELPTATAVIDRNPQSEENKNMRAEVLKRIDNIPNLKPQERSQLYAAVQKAKEMVKTITIPFALGQKALSPQGVEKLCEACHAPQVQKLVKDPSAVFVILGFADTIGSTESGMKLSTARADTVTSTLRDHCKLINRLQPVGMGSSEFFGADKKEKNRVVEVWVVIP